MRYHHKNKKQYLTSYAEHYICDHPVYSSCTLFRKDDVGLAIIQQRYDEKTKHTWWGAIDPWLIEELYLSDKFESYFLNHASIKNRDLYPTVTIRQIMWGLKMKPLQREKWETVFDKCDF